MDDANIENPRLARELRAWFDTRVPLLAYEVKREPGAEADDEAEQGAPIASTPRAPGF